MLGYNVCIFGYGQTGSGKTYTMAGEPSTGATGLVMLAVREVFQAIASDPERAVSLRFSCFEIYEDRIHDLLQAHHYGMATRLRLDYY